MQMCMKKNHNFRPISLFMSELMQDTAIELTMEGEQETAHKLSNGTNLNNFE